MSKKFKQKNLYKLIALIFWILIATIFFYYKIKYQLSYTNILEYIYFYLTENPYGPLLFIIFSSLRHFVFFPGILLILISGTLFGFWLGLLYSIIGFNISSNMAYFLAKIYAKNFSIFNKFKKITKLKEKLQNNGFFTILIMRLMYMPFGAIQYGAGIIKIKWKSYFLGTFIGTIPELITVVSFGASIQIKKPFDISQISLNQNQFLISIIFLIISILIAIIVKYKNHRKEINTILKNNSF